MTPSSCKRAIRAAPLVVALGFTLFIAATLPAPINLSSPPPLQAQSQSLVLHEGWTNLTYDGETLPIDQALGAVDGAIEAIWRWNPVDQSWSAWFPTAPAVASSLTTLAFGDVLWIRASVAIDWVPPRGVLFQRAQIRIESASGGQTIDVELADSPTRRGRGLMFRQTLPADEGMIFLFASDTSGGFWMQNTFVPLSIAFIDASGAIINIQDMQPLSTMTVSPGAPYRWALEMNQGWFAANDVDVGDCVRITGR